MNFRNNRLILFYIVPFIVILISQINYFINCFSQLDMGKYIIFVFINIIFILSLSQALGNIFIEASLNLSEDKDKTPSLTGFYKEKKFSIIKPLIIIAVFAGLFIFLSVNLREMGILKLLVMLIPPVAIFINSKFLIDYRVRFINSEYLYFKKQFTHIISFFVNAEDNVTFLCDDGNMIETAVNRTSFDFETFKTECIKNGLKTK